MKRTIKAEDKARIKQKEDELLEKKLIYLQMKKEQQMKK